MAETKNLKDKYNSEAPQEEVLCTNEYGFIIDDFHTASSVSSTTLKPQWYSLIELYGDNREKYRKSRRVQRLIKKGIPISLKYKMWKILVSKPLHYDYEDLISTPNEYYHQIHVDVQRTFRRHFLFCKSYGRGQSELFNILVAFSNHMPHIGYCQGMSNFAGILLMYFPEEEAFEMLVNIIKTNKLETLFDKSLSKIKTIQDVQLEIFKITVPDVLLHLLTNNIDISVYAISWYLTLFTRFDIELVLRIWDLFLYLDFTVLLFITASILQHCSPAITDLRGEQLVEFMSKIDTLELDIESIIKNTIDMINRLDYYYYKKMLDKS
ncbi:USP6 N-terminal-like protein [Nosema granulosis]|uniref:USP6 N-terminal-like protein n=1 Tax=Nosema granulosis TaxID=83296 RepID=A0A9P6H110_9MICR|nr:USP6 N-terminal-like protein [Nosema granulosis]